MNCVFDITKSTTIIQKFTSTKRIWNKSFSNLSTPLFFCFGHHFNHHGTTTHHQSAFLPPSSRHSCRRPTASVPSPLSRTPSSPSNPCTPILSPPFSAHYSLLLWLGHAHTAPKIAAVGPRCSSSTTEPRRISAGAPFLLLRCRATFFSCVCVFSWGMVRQLKDHW